MSLLDKLTKNSTIKLTSIITESKVFGKKDMATTPIPMLNVALSARIDGGLSPGLLMLAGPSKHFKSLFALLIASAYHRKHTDSVMLFYDSEFGSPQTYFDAFGIDMNRVVHTPITDIEELKFDIANQLRGLERSDKVVIVIDSVGNLASRKEVEDALNEKSVADMTRAKQMKSLFRIVTPHLTLKDIPLIVVNHTYKSMEMYSRDIVSGGSGIYYSSNDIWVIGRQQDKDTEGLHGYRFIINIEKSRHVIEKSKIPITVSFAGGISKWSGMLEVAEEGGFVTKPKKGWYEIHNPDTGEILGDKMFRADEINNNKEFWEMMFEKTDLINYINRKYALNTDRPMMQGADYV